MAKEIKITAARYKSDRDGHSLLELEINGRRVELLAEELKLLPTGYILLEGFGLPVISVSGAGYRVKGELSNDPTLISLATDFREAILEGRFQSLVGKPVSLPSP